jgi:hypothetical protein
MGIIRRTVTASLGGNTRYHFPLPQKTWTISHNRGTNFLNYQVFDLQGRRQIPSHTLTANELILSFTYPTAGYVDVVFGIGRTNEIY